jgi:hypothetical protein
MGIDIYLNWDGKTEEDQKKQYTGFSEVHGHVGYLREAYHGGPYATQVLIPEGFIDEDIPEDDKGVEISNDELQKRLPKVIKTIIIRYKKVYNEKITEDNDAIKSFKDFVSLHKEKEDAGLHPKIEASW